MPRNRGELTHLLGSYDAIIVESELLVLGAGLFEALERCLGAV
ncbi:hypothetical protein [Desulfurococcus mucosus]|nr:hypothetical protein [Desulfurococcus mucosus]